MEKVTIKFQRISDEFIDVDLPKYATPGSSGMDVRATVRFPQTIAPGNVALIPTGLKVEIPNGYELQVRPRSGLAIKIEEYVPTNIPRSRAKENSCIAEPPRKYRAASTIPVVSEVTMVLPRTSLMLVFIISEKFLSCNFAMFSRILSKTTTESLSE